MTKLCAAAMANSCVLWGKGVLVSSVSQLCSSQKGFAVRHLSPFFSGMTWSTWLVRLWLYWPLHPGPGGLSKQGHLGHACIELWLLVVGDSAWFFS